MGEKFKPLKFPEDGKPHGKSAEWWYFNGHLSDKTGHHYSFMDCFFRVNPRKTEIPFFRHIFRDKDDIYFGHHILTDIGRQKKYSAIKIPCIISKNSFKKSLFYVSYSSPLFFRNASGSEISEFKPFNYHIKTENFDLYLKARKPPLLEGGSGFIKINSQRTYYYSLTDLETKGTITINGKKIEVEGKSWFDHQWFQAIFSKMQWTWFSLQLENNVEIVCFKSPEGKNTAKLANIILADGKILHTDKVQIINEKDYWTSPKTKTAYPLSWRIKIPEYGVDVSVKPMAKEQEMLFGFINYWEGPLSVNGTFGGKKVSGQGFLELVGYPIKAGVLKVIEEEIKEMIKAL